MFRDTIKGVWCLLPSGLCKGGVLTRSPPPGFIKGLPRLLRPSAAYIPTTYQGSDKRPGPALSPPLHPPNSGSRWTLPADPTAPMRPPLSGGGNRPVRVIEAIVRPAEVWGGVTRPWRPHMTQVGPWLMARSLSFRLRPVEDWAPVPKVSRYEDGSLQRAPLWPGPTRDWRVKEEYQKTGKFTMIQNRERSVMLAF